MKQSINFYQFERAFKDMDRGNQFSYDGLKAIFEWFEQLDEDSGTETELDVIAICCEFAEYADINELKQDYPVPEDCEDDDEALEYFRNETIVLELANGGLVIQSY